MPAGEKLFDILLLGCRDCSGIGIAVVLSTEIPFDWAFVVEADAFVAVSGKVLTKGVAVGEDCDEHCGVVWAVGVHAILHADRLEVLGQIVEIDGRLRIAVSGVVDILDVHAAVGD